MGHYGLYMLLLLPHLKVQCLESQHQHHWCWLLSKLKVFENKNTSLDYHQFVYQGQNYLICHGNTRTQRCLGGLDKNNRNQFFLTNVNSKQIDKSQDGQDNINGRLSCQQQKYVKLVGWFWRNYC